MTKITPEHLARAAFVYVRQSTADQLVHNQESRRRQYGLADRARQLGWSKVVVVDDDLGRSGGGVSRPGFERLLAAICEGQAGAVLAIEASRLARNGRDWHTLIEFCGLVGTVIVDEDGIYDPRHPNDRLLLGMKGTMSELELSLFRQRSQEALKQKARRGALFLGVAAGYVKTGRERIEKDADQRVQDALDLVFSKFAELQSVRQVHVWLREEGIAKPAARRSLGAMSRLAKTVATPSSATTPAATGTARSVKAPPRANGWRNARPSFCRCLTTTWCSRCPRRSAPSPGRTRRKSTAFCSRRRPRRCLRSQPIPSIWAPGLASRRCCTVGAQRSLTTPTSI